MAQKVYMGVDLAKEFHQVMAEYPGANQISRPR